MCIRPRRQYLSPSTTIMEEDISRIEGWLIEMTSDEFDKVELPALNQLQVLGWSYVDGAKLAPDTSDERTSFKDAVLEKRLAESIKRLNPRINDENLRKVVRDLLHVPHTNLMEANQANWKTLT